MPGGLVSRMPCLASGLPGLWCVGAAACAVERAASRNHGQEDVADEVEMAPGWGAGTLHMHRTSARHSFMLDKLGRAKGRAGPNATLGLPRARGQV